MAIRRPTFMEGVITDANYKHFAAFVVVLGMIMAIVDSSIVNVAIPHMMAAFGTDLQTIEWVSTGYMLSMAVMMPTTGYLGDVFGRKKLYIFCLALFTVASMLCGAAWSTGSLIAFRVLQGIGGGAIQPVGQALLYSIFPREEQGRAMALVGMGAMLGPVVGPTLGGYLVEYVDWRSIFYVNLPVGIIAVIAGLLILRETQKHDSSFDRWGFTFMALFLTTILYAVSQGNSKGWDSPLILGFFLVAFISFCAFIAVELLVEDPVVDLSLFRYSVFSAGNVVSIAIGIGLFGGVFLLPVFVQNLMGLSALQTGILMLPGGLVVGLLMPLGGIAADKLPPWIPIGFGMLMLAISLFLQGTMTVDTGFWTLVWWQVLRGIGMAFAFPAMNRASLAAVPIKKIGRASGIYNLTRQLGGTFGIALLTTLLTSREVFHLDQIGENIHRALIAGPMQRMYETFLHRGSSAWMAQLQSRAMIGMLAQRQAAVWSFDDAFIAAGALCLLGLLPLWFMRKDIDPDAEAAKHMVMAE